MLNLNIINDKFKLVITWEQISDRQMDRQTDGQSDHYRTLDLPRGLITNTCSNIMKV